MQQFILNTVIQWIHYERRYAFYHSLVYKSGLHRPINMAQGIALLNPCRHTYSVQQHPSSLYLNIVATYGFNFVFPRITLKSCLKLF